MTTSQTAVTADPPRRRRSTKATQTVTPLTREEIDVKVSVWISERLSLRKMCAELKLLGASISEKTIRRRIEAMGLKSLNLPVNKRSGFVNSNDSFKGPWLSEYKSEIVQMSDNEMSYVQIWDALAKKYPDNCRFKGEVSNDFKSIEIGRWVYRERQKAVRALNKPTRPSLLSPITPAGPLTPAPSAGDPSVGLNATQPAIQYVYVQGPTQSPSPTPTPMSPPPRKGSILDSLPIGAPVKEESAPFKIMAPLSRFNDESDNEPTAITKANQSSLDESVEDRIEAREARVVQVRIDLNEKRKRTMTPEAYAAREKYLAGMPGAQK